MWNSKETRIYDGEEDFIVDETTTLIQIKFSLPLQDELYLRYIRCASKDAMNIFLMISL